MKCSSCGREIPDGVERCPGCGAVVGSKDALWDAVREEYREESDRVDDFINQIDIDYGDEDEQGSSESPEHRQGGFGERAERAIAALRELARGVPRWCIAAGAAALVVLVVGMALLFRSCHTAANEPEALSPSPTPAEVTETQSPGEPESPAPFSIGVEKLELDQGDTYKFSVSDSSAGQSGEFAQPDWSSSDEAVAVVDRYGVVTAVGEGMSVITATIGEASASCEVTVTANEFSEWMRELPPGISSDEYDIESARFYRFREKELTTSTASELEGWTVYDSLSVAGEFGEWSGWQTTPISANQTREVETRTEYSSRELVAPESWGEWSEWSYWSATRQTGREGEIEEQTRTTYRYFYYVCPNCGTRSPTMACAQQGCGGQMTEADLVEAWSEVSYDDAPRYEWSGLGDSDATYYRTVIDQSAYFFEDVRDGTNLRTEYRYRTRSYTPEQWSEWGEWSAQEATASAAREVRTRTVYRSRVMATQSLNYFWRWGEWSEPVEYAEGEASFESGEDIEFEDITLYRYREK